MKYGKACLIILAVALGISFLSSSLCYFDIIGNTLHSVFKIISILLGSFVGGFYIGKKSENKGYLEGMKVGGILVVFFFLLSYLGFHSKISLLKMVYYLLIFLIVTVGSVTGINKKKDSK